MDYFVYAINWTEFEFGSRPDGTSGHASMQEAEAFKQILSTGNEEQFWRGSDIRLVKVKKRIFDQIEKERNMWLTERNWYRPSS